MQPETSPDVVHSSPYSSSGKIVAQQIGRVHATSTPLTQIPQDRWIFAALT